MESGHESTALWTMSDEQEGTNDAATEDPSDKSVTGKEQDWQAILSATLESYRNFEKDGFVFDYRFMGKTYRNVDMLGYVPFWKADTEEADKLCGHYLSRNRNVKQLCRYCTTPNDLTDSCVYKFRLKMEAHIMGLCRRNDVEALRAMSQHCMEYACHGLRYGLHNKQGIHGACPIEMLHQILLGIFKYLKEEFFNQLGKDSALAEEINSLCTMIGSLLKRQSDRDLPKTSFSKGINKGKLMGKEMSGVILLLAAVLQTAAAQKLLEKGRNSPFKDPEAFDDWVMVLELLLQWEAYMKLPEMRVHDVRRLERKHRYLMFLCKRVMNRTKGMGMKLVKFHAILHISQDILNFGVPMNVDTGANEMHWKPAKSAAKLTQRDVRFFERQVATRVIEFFLLDLAMEELKGGKIWNYYEREQVDAGTGNAEQRNKYLKERIKKEKEAARIWTEGTLIQVLRNVHTDRGYITFPGSRMANQERIKWDQDLVDYLLDLQQRHFWPLQGNMPILTEHHRDGFVFRGHPNYRQLGHWHDWVLVDWGGTEPQPCQIWCFLDLSGLPDNFKVQLDGIRVEKGTYAVVESAHYLEPEPRYYPNEQRLRRVSDLFHPCVKEAAVLNANGSISKRQFYLADVEAFASPVSAFPDIGNEDKLRYLTIKPRNDWALDFQQWLGEDYEEQDLHDEYVALDHILNGVEEEDEEEEEEDDEEDEMKVKRRRISLSV